jgi:ribulose-5-phosphate 4-epimerase/fuculose-1-phosphate aldolase
MNLENRLYNLAEKFVSRPDHIQGAGGNVSIKSGDFMLIKASGVRFGDMRSISGVVKVGFRCIADYFIQTADLRETGESYSLRVIADSVLDNGMLKPSMETGFHAILDDVVIHTHSAFANILNCSRKWHELLLELSEYLGFKPLFVPYQSPGYALSKKLAEFKKNGCVTPVILLQNHGIIVHDSDEVQALEWVRKTDEALTQLFGLTGYNLSEHRYLDTFLYTDYLFPDQIVYFDPNNVLPSGQWSTSMCEIAQLYGFVRENILRNGMEPLFLEKEEVAYISGMAMEKHRKGIQHIE